MQFGGDVCTARFPHCTQLNTFFGFKSIDVFVCSCGNGVDIKDGLPW
jgi:hypothetical protein